MKPVPVNAIGGPHGKRVREILRRPIYHQPGPVEIFPCEPKLYEWLLDHPLWVAEYWRELGVPPCPTVTIDGGYQCRDTTDHVRVSFFPVYQDASMRIVYCVGELRQWPMPGWTKAEMVLVHRYRFTKQPDGAYYCAQQVEGFATTNRAALKALLKIARTTGERLLDRCLHEITLYFSVPCRIIQLRPRWSSDTADELRDRLPPAEGDQLRELIRHLPPLPATIPGLPTGFVEPKRTANLGVGN